MPTNNIRNALQGRLNALLEQHAAAYEQLNGIIDAVQEVKLKRNIARLEKEIAEIEKKLDDLPESVDEVVSVDERIENESQISSSSLPPVEQTQTGSIGQYIPIPIKDIIDCFPWTTSYLTWLLLTLLAIVADIAGLFPEFACSFKVGLVGFSFIGGAGLFIFSFFDRSHNHRCEKWNRKAAEKRDRIITLFLTIIWSALLGFLTYQTCNTCTLPSCDKCAFVYQVQVQQENNSLSIYDAEVFLKPTNTITISKRTDSNGVALFELDCDYGGETATLSVQKDGFNNDDIKTVREVRLEKGAQIEDVRLEPNSS